MFGLFEDSFSVFFVYCVVAFLADAAWMAFTRRTPTYKRHLTIMCLFGLFLAAKELHLSRPPDIKSNWLICAIGAISGLCLSSLPFLLGSRNPKYGWARGSSARPDPSRRLVIVADPHWSEELTGLQQATLAMSDADWLFLGDAFEVWVGVKGLQTDSQRNFIWWVHERRRTGHWVGLWLGNREYFLDSFAHKFDFMGEGVGGALQGEQIVFEHGDLVNTGDTLYRLWNLVSRSWPVWLIAKMIPSFIGRKLAPVLEKALQTTNAANKVEFPKAEFQLAAVKCGAPMLITGHFHTHEEVENGFSIPWATNGKFFLWEKGKFSPIDFNPNRKHVWGVVDDQPIEPGSD